MQGMCIRSSSMFLPGESEAVVAPRILHSDEWGMLRWIHNLTKGVTKEMAGARSHNCS